MLVVAVAASSIVVVIDLHVALTALTLNGEGVCGSHALDVRHAHFLVVFTGLDLEHHGTFHAQRAKVIDGTLNGSRVGIGTHGVSTALATGHGDSGTGSRLIYSHYSAIDGDRLQRD